MNKITFKKATLADHATVLKLIQEYFSYDGIAWNRHIPQGLKTLLRRKSLGQVFLFQVDSLNVGYSVLTYGYDLEFGGPQVTITDLYLQSEYRRLGIGNKFFSHLSDFCRKKGVKAIELQVERDNHEARGFYKKMDFNPHDRIPMSKWIQK